MSRPRLHPLLLQSLDSDVTAYAESHPRKTARVYLSDSVVINRPADKLGRPIIMEFETDYLEMRLPLVVSPIYRIDTAAVLRAGNTRRHDMIRDFYLDEANTYHMHLQFWADRLQWLQIWQTSTILQMNASGLGGMQGPALVGMIALVIGTHNDIYSSTWDRMLYVFDNRERFGL